MNPVSDIDINEEYEIRRLSGLRQLAYKVNEKLTDINSNSLIQDIESKNSDDLYFAILARMRVTSISIPEALGYGYHYDKLFALYSSTLGYYIDDESVPYLMIKNPDKIFLTYLMVYNGSDSALILNNLKDGSGRGRDKKLTELLETSNKNVILKEIINMMINEEFDVLDSIYIVLYIDDEYKARSIAFSDIISKFKQYIK